MPAQLKNVTSRNKPQYSIDKLRQRMRRLWVDHVLYTRLYMISFLSGLPDADFLAKRLMRNQEEIGSALGTFYGQKNGDLITSLLKSHIDIAVELLKALKAGNKDKAAVEQKKWDENAKSISMILGQINPNWNTKDMYAHFSKHLALTTNEAISFVSKDYDNSIKAFDAAMDQGQQMADVLSAGVHLQFNNKFW